MKLKMQDVFKKKISTYKYHFQNKLTNNNLVTKESDSILEKLPVTTSSWYFSSIRYYIQHNNSKKHFPTQTPFFSNLNPTTLKKTPNSPI